MPDPTDALANRAERTRNHLTRLVDSLQNQITPAELMGQLVGRSSNGGGPSLTEMLTAQVSRNPMACMLIAAGIGWLMITERGDQGRPVKKSRAPVRRKRRPSRKIAR